MHLPIAIIETLIFSCVLYPMVGLSLVFKQWAFFYLQLVLEIFDGTSFFRVIALVSPTMEVAQSYPGPFIAVMILFAGQSVRRRWVVSPMYWAAIFAYCLRSLCQVMNFCPASTKCWYPTIPWVRQLSWRTIRNTTPLRWWSFALRAGDAVLKHGRDYPAGKIGISKDKM